MSFPGRVGLAVAVLAGFWFVAALAVQGARCTGPAGMVMRSQGILGIVMCIIASDPGDMLRFRDAGRR